MLIRQMCSLNCHHTDIVGWNAHSCAVLFPSLWTQHLHSITVFLKTIKGFYFIKPRTNTYVIWCLNHRSCLFPWTVRCFSINSVLPFFIYAQKMHEFMADVFRMSLFRPTGKIKLFSPAQPWVASWVKGCVCIELSWISPPPQATLPSYTVSNPYLN